MLNIEDIISGDFSQYPEETQEYMKRYSDKFRDVIIDELIDDRKKQMLKDVENGDETYISILTNLLAKGCKGYDKMSTRALLNIYLEDKNREDFIKVLEKVNGEIK